MFGVAVREPIRLSVLVSSTSRTLHYPYRAREIRGLKTRTDSGHLLNLFVDAWIYDNLCQGEKDAEKIVSVHGRMDV